MVHAYIDDVLLITENDHRENLNSFDKSLLRIVEASLKVKT